MDNYKVAVIGAAGHVGCPYALVNAVAGNDVIAIDLDIDKIKKLNKGILPFKENLGEKYLQKALETNKIAFTTDYSEIIDCDVVCIMIGVPIDEEDNPRLEGVLKCAEQIAPYINKNTIVILRSTVSLGCTEIFKNHLKREVSKYTQDFEPIVGYCPERVAQGQSILESEYLPQIIGVDKDENFEKIKNYVNSYNTYNFTTSIPLLQLTFKEAELAKVMTNMFRYVNFALANEFYMIGAKENINIEKVITTANQHYSRMNMALPGANVGGYCLTKDGKFLLSSVPYVDLLRTSGIINEGMPDFIYETFINNKANPLKDTIAIHGMAFKANSDDTRNSLSFKMKKVLQKHGYRNILLIDPNVPGYLKTIPKNESVAFHIIMTPHDNFKTLDKDRYEELKHRPNAKNEVVIDSWKCTESGKNSITGEYKITVE